MPTKLTDTELRAWQALLHAHEQLVRVLDAELRAEHGITLHDYDVLVRLARAEDRTLRMSQLAERVMVPPSTLTRRVDRLVADGLVLRSRSPDDARLMLVRISEDGLRIVRRAARTHLRGIREHFSRRLDEEQLRAVGDALQTITGPHQPH
ncbi:MAG TPA: MarR family transcriptional regulator [Actinomycetes bacterium]|nr:MarR family transcriptional regulator [Actinomycetes bacterium]